MLELLRLDTSEASALLRERGISEVAVIDHDPDVGLTWSFPKRGIEIRFDRERVVTVFLFGVAAEDYQPHQDPPFEGLEWKATFEDVQAAMGTPSLFSDGNPDSQFGPIPPWLRYDTDRYSVHFEFSEDKESIAKVTFMTEAP